MDYPNFVGMFNQGGDFSKEVLDSWAKGFSAEECSNELDYKGFTDQNLEEIVDAMYKLLDIQQDVDFRKLLEGSNPKQDTDFRKFLEESID